MAAAFQRAFEGSISGNHSPAAGRQVYGFAICIIAFWKRWAVDPSNRCLIPTARFAEAVGERGRMTETWIAVKDQPVFDWAGLWTDSVEWGAVYTGVMTENCIELADVHDRSPVILDPSDWDTWLHAPLDELYQFDRPYPADRIHVDRTDSPWFRRKGSDGPTLL